MFDIIGITLSHYYGHHSGEFARQLRLEKDRKTFSRALNECGINNLCQTIIEVNWWYLHKRTGVDLPTGNGQLNEFRNRWISRRQTMNDIKTIMMAIDQRPF